MLARYTRTGRYLSLLPSVEASLPADFVDGEFWYVFFFLLLFILISFFLFSYVPFVCISLFFCFSTTNCSTRFGRGQFPFTYMLCKGSDEYVSWQFLRYVRELTSRNNMRSERRGLREQDEGKER